MMCVLPVTAGKHTTNSPHGCRTLDAFGHPTSVCLGSAAHRRALSNLNGEVRVKKILIVAGATLALVTAANAADLPRREPVPAYPAPVGKMPIGKSPVGKAPIGKAPGPVVSRY
jgi:hypothetical protein